MKLSTEKILININELLKMIKDIKTMIYLYDNDEIL